MPIISVCIPTYNRAHYLAYAVNSVLQQTYTDFELIICDDGSKDNTAEVVSQWNDPRIRYIRHSTNVGRSRNMRSGFKASQGKYFIKFDDDDAITPEFLAKTAAVLDTEPEVDFVCTDHWIINAKGERIESATRANSAKWGKDKIKRGIIPDLLRQTFQFQSLQIGSILFRRDCLADLDFVLPENDGFEDLDLLIRVALAGKKGYFLPELLMEYRYHGGQGTLELATHCLSAKVSCLKEYSFPDQELERFRIQKLAETEQTLGLRLIEKGETAKGRQLIRTSRQVLGNSLKTNVGLLLSYLPVSWRQFALQGFRNTRPKDYIQQLQSKAAD